MRRVRATTLSDKAITRPNGGTVVTTTHENETNTITEEHEQAAAVEDTDTGEINDETPARDQLTIETMQTELAARDERVSALEEQVITLERELSTTVSRYRLALLDTAPEVPGDLVSGTTAEELESSLAKAKGVVEQVRNRLLEGMESDASPHSADRRNPSESSGIPAGAPPRSIGDASADLTAREKITLGLERI